MQSDNNYQVNNVLQYTRKSYKKNRNAISLEAYTSGRHGEVDDIVLDSPQGESNCNRATEIIVESAGCSCDINTDGEIANILHKKYPVIALAQQQLQKLLTKLETDKLLSDNTRCCRSGYDFLILCKENLWDVNKCRCIIVVLILSALFLGIILGAASCGMTLRRFNSPILTCIDNLFLSNKFATFEESFRAIV